MLLVVCQLSRDVIGYEDSYNVTGALLSVYCHSLRLAVFLSYLCYSIAADGCADNPCRFGSTCLDGGATCNCTQGLQGRHCSEGRQHHDC